MFGHDYEPIPGLPAPLPAGEAILWQGRPDWRALARGALHTRAIAVYFGLLLAWGVASRFAEGEQAGETAIAMLELCGMGVLAISLLTMFAWLSARTTMYTITARRVVLRIGIALPVTIQIPFSKIESANVKAAADGSGDISLALGPDQHIAYLVLWPHARPWRFRHPEPTLRGLANAGEVAPILGRALAAASEHTVSARSTAIRVDPAPKAAQPGSGAPMSVVA